MPSLRSFDLNLLVLFDALYRERQLSAAASAIGLSQPAASQALARLRDALGDPLFERRARGMEPTPFADALAPTVRESLRALEQKLLSATRFEPEQSDREFGIGLAEVGELFFFPSLLARVTAAAPRVRLRSVPPRHLDVQTSAARGEVDLGFDFEPPTLPGLQHRVVGTEELVVIARRGHPRVSGEVTILTYLSEARVRIEMPDERWKRLLSALGVSVGDEAASPMGVVGTVSQITSVPAVVSQTDAVALVPRAVARLPAFRDQLQIIPCPVPLPPLTIYAYWHESYEMDPGHAWLRTFLTQKFWDT